MPAARARAPVDRRHSSAGSGGGGCQRACRPPRAARHRVQRRRAQGLGVHLATADDEDRLQARRVGGRGEQGQRPHRLGCQRPCRAGGGGRRAGRLGEWMRVGGGGLDGRPAPPRRVQWRGGPRSSPLRGTGPQPSAMQSCMLTIPQDAGVLPRGGAGEDHVEAPRQRTELGGMLSPTSSAP